MNDLATSIIRTLAGHLAALIIAVPGVPAILDQLGMSQDTATASLTAALAIVFSALWYLVARLLEHHNHPTAGGRMLIVPSTPDYGRSGPGGSVCATCAGRVSEGVDAAA